MQIHAEEGGPVLELFPAEAHFLADLFRRIAQTYEESNQRHFQDRSMEKSGYARDDIESWAAEVESRKADHARLARTWVEILQARNPGWIRWKLSPAEIEHFLLLANDHRIYLMNQFEITEVDMEMEPDDFTDHGRRLVLLEIHLLAQMMELLLPFAPL